MDIPLIYQVFEELKMDSNIRGYRIDLKSGVRNVKDYPALKQSDVTQYCLTTQISI